MPELKKNFVVFESDDEKVIEEFVGIEIYSTPDIKGINGDYKTNYIDFIVKEITNDGKILEIKEDSPPIPFSRDTNDKYTTFNLVKIEKDTFEAINQLCSTLHIPSHFITYSGLKDKHAVTVQKVSIRGNFVEKLQEIEIDNLYIRSINPTRKPVRLGSNRGNHFIITIRNIEDVPNLENTLQKSIDTLKKKGFPNYFGLQRFGKYRPNSHLVGKLILKKEYEQTFNEFILRKYSSESPRLQQIRDKVRHLIYDEQNFSEVLNIFPKSLSYEWDMLDYFNQHPMDFKGAVFQLPKKLITLLINAFQSYLFNRMISLRVSENYPLAKPVKGDNICILDDLNGQPTNVNYIYGSLYDEYLEEALEMGRAAIVAPIVGYDTDLNNYPLMQKFFTQILEEESIDPSIFQSEWLKEFEFKGSFRPIVIRPVGLDMLELEDDEVNQGKKKVKIEFSLLKGSYATMLLREIMK
ncbi:MAG: putative tRNA pseudouridine synthase D [Promethearchaeota archaeon]|nr:MAG: putative tRNA pseudouridine synthase D [Candidatus Lokiarchaeota archaeon]